MKNLLLKIIAFPGAICNFITLRRKKVIYDKTLKINGKIRIYGRGKIVIGKDVTINSSISSNPTGGDICTVLSVDPGAVLEIGEGSGLSNCAVVCKKHIKIGNNVKIGTSVKIYDSDFHSRNAQERIRGKDRPENKEIVIKNGAFIGGHSIVLKGVVIGENSIVGAGSVVTKNIPDGEIWAGNPARFIKEA